MQFSKTGVKYLQQIAQRFDIGVYFEANGHGTVSRTHKSQRSKKKKTNKNPRLRCCTFCSCHGQVVFSKAAEEEIHQLAENPSANDEAKRAALMLQNSVNVINQVRARNSRENHQ